jgi:hypothetical protein
LSSGLHNCKQVKIEPRSAKELTIGVPIPLIALHAVVSTSCSPVQTHLLSATSAANACVTVVSAVYSEHPLFALGFFSTCPSSATTRFHFAFNKGPVVVFAFFPFTGVFEMTSDEASAETA